MNQIRPLFLLFFSLQALTFFGQNEELLAYKNQFPQESRVVLKDITNIRIFFNANDSLNIKNTSEKEVLYLDKEAGKHAKSAVSSSYFRKVTSLEAATYLPSGKKKYKKEEITDFEEKAVLDRNIFYDDSKKIYFTYPNLREGAKSYLKYTTLLNTPELMTGAFFGDFAPTIYQELKITHPKNVEVSFRNFNGIDSLVSYEKREEGDVVTHLFVGKDLPILKYEGNAPPLQSYVPMVYPVINSYTVNGEKIELLGDTKKLHDWYARLLKLQDTQVNQSLKNTADSLARGLDTEISVVKEVHKWVQRNIKYVAYEDGLGGFVPRAPQQVYDRKFGDCKDMSTIQVAMLTHLGIKAYVAWVGTRDIPYTYEELPTAACDNHMIAMYKSEQGEWYVLDGTNYYTPFEYPSEFIQGKEVMVHLAEDKYEIVKIEPVSAAQNVTKDESTLIIEGKNLSGTGTVSFTGYPLIDMKYQVLEADSTKRANYFKAQLLKGSNKFYFELQEFQLPEENLAEVKYKYEIQDYISTNKDEVYVNLNLEKLFAGSKIENDRKLGIVSDYFQETENIYHLDLGGVYEVSFLPENLVIDSPNLKVDLMYEKTKNRVTYILKVQSKHLVIEPENFESWNEVIKKLNKKYKEVIVLKKIPTNE